MIRSTDSLASLALAVPGAARVFQAVRLDYYCHGDRSLAEACREHQLDPDAVAARILDAPAPASPMEDWDALPVPELVRQVQRRYHDPLHPELIRLQELARHVETLDAAQPECPRGLARHLEGFCYALEEHLAKEEEILFPLLASGQFERVAPAIRAMRAEHEQHAEALRHTRRLTHDFRVPDCACAAWRALAPGLEDLERGLMDHMHVENYVLFPRALVPARR